MRSAASARTPPGLTVRCEWGPQHLAAAWINEVKGLGMTITPSYFGEPECNGVVECFMRTLKEPRIYLHRFETLPEAQRIIGEFIARYHGYARMAHLSARRATSMVKRPSPSGMMASRPRA
jgi:hypothetical protein